MEFEYIPEIDAVVNWKAFRDTLERFKREHPVDVVSVRAIQKHLTDEEQLAFPLPECIQSVLDAEVIG